MNAVRKLLYLPLLSLLLTGCAGNPNMPDETNSTMEMTSDTDAYASSEQRNVADAVVHYLLLKDALVASNASLAKEKAIQLLGTIDATQMPDAQPNTRKIAATEDLNEQRLYFDSLSHDLYQHIKSRKGNQQTLYKQHCPMAFNNRGAFWLSNSEEIQNPYFGEKMLRCGKTEEIIEPER